MMLPVLNKVLHCLKDPTCPVILQHCWFVKPKWNHTSMAPSLFRNL